MSCKYNCNHGKVFVEGLGKFVNCPDCSSISKAVEVKENGKEIFERLMIPDIYLNEPLRDEELFLTSDIGSAYSKSSISRLIKLLSSLNHSLENGSILSASAYVHTTSFVDDSLFIYPYMRTAFEKGFSTVPCISVNTLYSMRMAMDYNLKDPDSYNESNKLKMTSEQVVALSGLSFIKAYKVFYSDYILADVCVLDMTATTSNSALYVLADLLAERGKLNRPTLVFGYSRSNSYNLAYSLGHLLAKRDERFSSLSKLVPYELTTDKYERVATNGAADTRMEIETVLAKGVGGISIESVLKDSDKVK